MGVKITSIQSETSSSLLLARAMTHPLPCEQRYPDVELVFHFDPGNALYLKTKEDPSVTAESFCY